MTRPRSNALTHEDPRFPHWGNPAHKLNITRAGPYRLDQSGYMLLRYPETSEGWKFHISAYPYNAEALAEVVLPLLTRMNVAHKYLELHKLGTLAGNAVGKFIAYYPVSPADAHAIALAIQSSVASMGNLQGPVIQDEMRFGSTGILYTRYGSYRNEYISGPPETETKSLDPARGRRTYHQGYIRPSWIPDLNADHSTTKFPLYDARRKLRSLKESEVPWVN